jgi:hypothetical protein
MDVVRANIASRVARTIEHDHTGQPIVSEWKFYGKQTSDEARAILKELPDEERTVMRVSDKCEERFHGASDMFKMMVQTGFPLASVCDLSQHPDAYEWPHHLQKSLMLISHKFDALAKYTAESHPVNVGTEIRALVKFLLLVGNGFDLEEETYVLPDHITDQYQRAVLYVSALHQAESEEYGTIDADSRQLKVEEQLVALAWPEQEDKGKLATHGNMTMGGFVPRATRVENETSNKRTLIPATEQLMYMDNRAGNAAVTASMSNEEIARFMDVVRTQFAKRPEEVPMRYVYPNNFIAAVEFDSQSITSLVAELEKEMYPDFYVTCTYVPVDRKLYMWLHSYVEYANMMCACRQLHTATQAVASVCATGDYTEFGKKLRIVCRSFNSLAEHEVQRDNGVVTEIPIRPREQLVAYRDDTTKLQGQLMSFKGMLTPPYAKRLADAITAGRMQNSLYTYDNYDQLYWEKPGFWLPQCARTSYISNVYASARFMHVMCVAGLLGQVVCSGEFARAAHRHGLYTDAASTVTGIDGETGMNALFITNRCARVVDLVWRTGALDESVADLVKWTKAVEQTGVYTVHGPAPITSTSAETYTRYIMRTHLGLGRQHGDPPEAIDPSFARDLLDGFWRRHAHAYTIKAHGVRVARVVMASTKELLDDIVMRAMDFVDEPNAYLINPAAQADLKKRESKLADERAVKSLSEKHLAEALEKAEGDETDTTVQHHMANLKVSNDRIKERMAEVRRARETLRINATMYTEAGASGEATEKSALNADLCKKMKELMQMHWNGFDLSFPATCTVMDAGDLYLKATVVSRGQLYAETVFMRDKYAGDDVEVQRWKDIRASIEGSPTPIAISVTTPVRIYADDSLPVALCVAEAQRSELLPRDTHPVARTHWGDVRRAEYDVRQTWELAGDGTGGGTLLEIVDMTIQLQKMEAEKNGLLAESDGFEQGIRSALAQGPAFPEQEYDLLDPIPPLDVVRCAEVAYADVSDQRQETERLLDYHGHLRRRVMAISQRHRTADGLAETKRLMQLMGRASIIQRTLAILVLAQSRPPPVVEDGTDEMYRRALALRDEAKYRSTVSQLRLSLLDSVARSRDLDFAGADKVAEMHRRAASEVAEFLTSYERISRYVKSMTENKTNVATLTTSLETIESEISHSIADLERIRSGSSDPDAITEQESLVAELHKERDARAKTLRVTKDRASQYTGELDEVISGAFPDQRRWTRETVTDEERKAMDEGARVAHQSDMWCVEVQKCIQEAERFDARLAKLTTDIREVQSRIEKARVDNVGEMDEWEAKMGSEIRAYLSELSTRKGIEASRERQRVAEALARIDKMGRALSEVYTSTGLALVHAVAHGRGMTKALEDTITKDMRRVDKYIEELEQKRKEYADMVPKGWVRKKTRTPSDSLEAVESRINHTAKVIGALNVLKESYAAAARAPAKDERPDSLEKRRTIEDLTRSTELRQEHNTKLHDELVSDASAHAVNVMRHRDAPVSQMVDFAQGLEKTQHVDKHKLRALKRAEQLLVKRIEIHDEVKAKRHERLEAERLKQSKLNAQWEEKKKQWTELKAKRTAKKLRQNVSTQGGETSASTIKSKAVGLKEAFEGVSTQGGETSASTIKSKALGLKEAFEARKESKMRDTHPVEPTVDSVDLEPPRGIEDIRLEVEEQGDVIRTILYRLAEMEYLTGRGENHAQEIEELGSTLPEEMYKKSVLEEELKEATLKASEEEERRLAEEDARLEEADLLAEASEPRRSTRVIELELAHQKHVIEAHRLIIDNLNDKLSQTEPGTDAAYDAMQSEIAESEAVIVNAMRATSALRLDLEEATEHQEATDKFYGEIAWQYKKEVVARNKLRDPGEIQVKYDKEVAVRNKLQDRGEIQAKYEKEVAARNQLLNPKEGAWKPKNHKDLVSAALAERNAEIERLEAILAGDTTSAALVAHDAEIAAHDAEINRLGAILAGDKTSAALVAHEAEIAAHDAEIERLSAILATRSLAETSDKWDADRLQDKEMAELIIELEYINDLVQGDLAILRKREATLESTTDENLQLQLEFNIEGLEKECIAKMDAFGETYTRMQRLGKAAPHTLRLITDPELVKEVMKGDPASPLDVSSVCPEDTLIGVDEARIEAELSAALSDRPLITQCAAEMFQSHQVVTKAEKGIYVHRPKVIRAVKAYAEMEFRNNANASGPLKDANRHKAILALLRRRRDIALASVKRERGERLQSLMESVVKESALVVEWMAAGKAATAKTEWLVKEKDRIDERIAEISAHESRVDSLGGYSAAEVAAATVYATNPDEIDKVHQDVLDGLPARRRKRLLARIGAYLTDEWKVARDQWCKRRLREVSDRIAKGLLAIKPAHELFASHAKMIEEIDSKRREADRGRSEIHRLDEEVYPLQIKEKEKKLELDQCTAEINSYPPLEVQIVTMKKKLWEGRQIERERRKARAEEVKSNRTLEQEGKKLVLAMTKRHEGALKELNSLQEEMAVLVKQSQEDFYVFAHRDKSELRALQVLYDDVRTDTSAVLMKDLVDELLTEAEGRSAEYKKDGGFLYHLGVIRTELAKGQDELAKQERQAERNALNRRKGIIEAKVIALNADKIAGVQRLRDKLNAMEAELPPKGNTQERINVGEQFMSKKRDKIAKLKLEVKESEEQKATIAGQIAEYGAPAESDVPTNQTQRDNQAEIKELETRQHETEKKMDAQIAIYDKLAAGPEADLKTATDACKTLEVAMSKENANRINKKLTREGTKISEQLRKARERVALCKALTDAIKEHEDAVNNTQNLNKSDAAKAVAKAFGKVAACSGHRKNEYKQQQAALDEYRKLRSEQTSILKQLSKLVGSGLEKIDLLRLGAELASIDKLIEKKKESIASNKISLKKAKAGMNDLRNALANEARVRASMEKINKHAEKVEAGIEAKKLTDTRLLEEREPMLPFDAEMVAKMEATRNEIEVIETIQRMVDRLKSADSTRSTHRRIYQLMSDKARLNTEYLRLQSDVLHLLGYVRQIQTSLTEGRFTYCPLRTRTGVEDDADKRTFTRDASFKQFILKSDKINKAHHAVMDAHLCETTLAAYFNVQRTEEKRNVWMLVYKTYRSDTSSMEDELLSGLNLFEEECIDQTEQNSFDIESIRELIGNEDLVRSIEEGAAESQKVEQQVVSTTAKLKETRLLRLRKAMLLQDMVEEAAEKKEEAAKVAAAEAAAAEAAAPPTEAVEVVPTEAVEVVPTEAVEVVPTEAVEAVKQEAVPTVAAKVMEWESAPAEAVVEAVPVEEEDPEIVSVRAEITEFTKLIEELKHERSEAVAAREKLKSEKGDSMGPDGRRLCQLLNEACYCKSSTKMMTAAKNELRLAEERRAMYEVEAYGEDKGDHDVRWEKWSTEHREVQSNRLTLIGNAYRGRTTNEREIIALEEIMDSGKKTTTKLHRKVLDDKSQLIVDRLVVVPIPEAIEYLKTKFLHKAPEVRQAVENYIADKVGATEKARLAREGVKLNARSKGKGQTVPTKKAALMSRDEFMEREARTALNALKQEREKLESRLQKAQLAANGASQGSEGESSETPQPDVGGPDSVARDEAASKAAKEVHRIERNIQVLDKQIHIAEQKVLRCTVTKDDDFNESDLEVLKQRSAVYKSYASVADVAPLDYPTVFAELMAKKEQLRVLQLQEPEATKKRMDTQRLVDEIRANGDWYADKTRPGAKLTPEEEERLEREKAEWKIATENSHDAFKEMLGIRKRIRSLGKEIKEDANKLHSLSKSKRTTGK